MEERASALICKHKTQIMYNSLSLLFEEHEYISDAIEVARNAESLLGINDQEYEETISELIRFFRNYGDLYHHHKEEQILFPEMAKKNELLSEGILKEMYDNHSYFRELLLEIEYHLEAIEYTEASVKIAVYTESLSDHIAVEKEELFQAASSLFTSDELENISYRFIDMDREVGELRKRDLTEALKLLNS